MLRIAIVGCGKIADQHVQAIHRLSECRLVSLCDQELLMARQLGERFGVSECFSDLAEMLAATSPDVVHISTPPQGHYLLAKQCLQSGSHVYLEKPFTITAEEADSLIQLAQSQGLKITAGHNYQFTLEMLEMRRLVGEGFLGGRPVHLESQYSYDLGDRSYAGPLLGNRNHSRGGNRSMWRHDSACVCGWALIEFGARRGARTNDCFDHSRLPAR